MKATTIFRRILGVVICGGAIYFFVLPFFIVLRELGNETLANGQMPDLAYRLHSSLSPKFEDWAKGRTRSGEAANVSVGDVSGTEWPMFSAVFYLWATESLQNDWVENDRGAADLAPASYSSGAVAAALGLIVDPHNAGWVQIHWGPDYLERENLFYRMLLISGLTSYQALSEDERFSPLSRKQVESLAQKLDESAHGLLDDYPGQCYPVDIVPAIAAIKRADAVLGTDHSRMIERAIRGFVGEKLDPLTGLPSYVANSRTGQGIGPARGVGLAFMATWAQELWPEVATRWYTEFDRQFWQKGRVLSGFREFSSRSAYPDWTFDIDAGPVVAGIGVAASAFGLGAARVNGDLGHSQDLAAEAVVASWPLANGTLLVPWILSNVSEAPYLGEAALLFALTRTSSGSLASPGRTHGWPGVVYIGLGFYLVSGVIGVWVGLLVVAFSCGSDPVL